MNSLKILLTIPLFLSSQIYSGHHEEEGASMKAMMSNIETAKSWINAGYTDKDSFLAIVKNHMSEDGYNYPGRFIGFGFNFNPSNDQMVVDWVIENSPAVGVLQKGDIFVSVEGVPATRTNRENGVLSFTGLPGKPVRAVVERNGKNVDVSFNRGLVSPRYTKAQVVNNIESSDAEDWGADEYRIIEVASNRKNNVVYAWTWHKFTDDITGLQFEENQVTRFQFNDEGQVIARGDMSEEALVQSQLGFKVSR
tara:strand:- start:1543 stop:2298 length:756 start_codon:yes stop_codon:yes gene_type:complete